LSVEETRPVTGETAEPT